MMMGLILFIVVLYFVKAAVIMIDKDELISKSRLFVTDLMHSSPANAGLFFFA